MTASGQAEGARIMAARREFPWLAALGAAQLFLWGIVAALSGRFTPGSEFGRRPLLAVMALLAANFILYLASLALVWNQPADAKRARAHFRVALIFAVLFRLPVWWSQPIQEVDLYRYLWDGRVLAEGVNPYRYSPAQVEAALEGGQAAPDLERLAELLRHSPEEAAIFSEIEHRSVPTIYPPLSEALFAAVAAATPERASVLMQMRALKGVLLLFDLATVALAAGLLRNLRQPPARALAYAWCPLVLKEFANSGHVDSVAVCLTVGMFWLLTKPRQSLLASRTRRASRPTARDWLAAGLWAGAVLAKLYPLALAPVLLAYWWRQMRWRISGLVVVFALVVLGGYMALPRNSKAARQGSRADLDHSDFSGLREFLNRWEINDLLFSIVYENVKPGGNGSSDRAPWYSVLPSAARTRLNAALESAVSAARFKLQATQLAFLFTQALAGGMVFVIVCWLALRRWPGDPREELLRRAFLCLAWLWYLSATQNPWYWTWALPFVVFASRPWLLVSGFALVYYLRFWLIHAFPQATLPGDLTGQRFFDEVVVWAEHIPVLLALLMRPSFARLPMSLIMGRTR